MLKFNRLSIATLLLLLALPVVAQTASGLRQEYQLSLSVESYEVRPGIIATFFYAENNQIAEIMVRPRLFYINDLSKNEMPFKVAEDILDEFVPKAKRGKTGFDMGFESGRNYYRHISDENVDVDMSVHNRDTPQATVSDIDIFCSKMAIEFKHKYKSTPAIESYEVRPGITATFFFGENGEAVSGLIRPHLFYTDDLSENEMPLKVAKNILNEFAPPEKRGKLCSDDELESEDSYFQNITYGNVDIHMTVKNRKTPQATVSRIYIRWAEVICN